jgi:hypothetical protein
MSHDLPDMDDRTLFQRLARPAAPADRTPDAMALAAWLDGQDEADAAAVEAALAADPALFDDLRALRPPVQPETPSPAFLARAQALVPAAAESAPTGTVLPFRQRKAALPTRRAGTWLAWSAVAASVACIAVAGFNLGSQFGETFYPTTSAADQHETAVDSLDAAASVTDVVS